MNAGVVAAGPLPAALRSDRALQKLIHRQAAPSSTEATSWRGAGNSAPELQPALGVQVPDPAGREASGLVTSLVLSADSSESGASRAEEWGQVCGASEVVLL